MTEANPVSRRGPGPGKGRDSRAESRVGKSTHTESRFVVARGWQGGKEWW